MRKQAWNIFECQEDYKSKVPHSASPLDNKLLLDCLLDGEFTNLAAFDEKNRYTVSLKRN